MSTPQRLRLQAVQYRQGFVEVSNIHSGCVNVETWSIDANVDLSNVEWVAAPSLSDDHVNANTELEFTAAEARLFAKYLLDAADRAEVVPSDRC